MKPLRSITSLISAFLVGLIIFITPLAYNTTLAQPSDGYLICLVAGTIILTLYLIIKILFSKGFYYFGLSMPDLLLILLVGTCAVSIFINNSNISLESVLKLIGLIIIYITVRSLKPEQTATILFFIIFSGILQAIYGNLQLYELYPSHHYQFKITGSFFNPGPYAGYLAVVFPVALALSARKPDAGANRLYLIIKQLSVLNFIPVLHYFYLAALILILIVLPSTRSRSAWLAAIISSCFLIATFIKSGKTTDNYFREIIPLKLSIKIRSPKIKVFLIVSFVILICTSGISLYYMKKDSADGRLLIWKVTTEMIADKPVTGHGPGGFEANYMNYQADYFAGNTDSEKALLAGNNKYTFNIFLKLLTEYGLIGFIIVLLLLYHIFFGNTIKKGDHFTINAARASILSAIIFGMFSYPEDILPLNVIIVTALALVTSYLKPISFTHSKTNNKPVSQYSIRRKKPGRIIMVLVLSFLFMFSVLKGTKLYKAYQNWTTAYKIYQMGAYKSCIDDYRNAYPALRYNGDFLLNYGKALSMAEEHEEAIRILNEAGIYYPNTVMFTALGDSYKALGIYENAEEAYIKAMNMTPDRFYPEYLLAKLYFDTGKLEKAIKTATNVLNKHVKIPSPAIEEIKTEMKELITEVNNK